MTEHDRAGRVTGSFTGKRFPYGRIAGVWRSPDGSRVRPFVFVNEPEELIFELGPGSRIRAERAPWTPDTSDATLGRATSESSGFSFSADPPSARIDEALAAFERHTQKEFMTDTRCIDEERAVADVDAETGNPCENHTVQFSFEQLPSGFVDARVNTWSYSEGHTLSRYRCMLLDTVRGTNVDLAELFAKIRADDKPRAVRDAVMASATIQVSDRERAVRYLLDGEMSVCVVGGELLFTLNGGWGECPEREGAVRLDGRGAAKLFPEKRFKNLFKALVAE